ncbi:hypothetical protein LXA43DRAFT_902821, partial [Ganoderma leucocontextum]
MGVHCQGFGQQLHDYQLSRGQALPRELSLARALYDPPKRHRWILVWTEHNTPPHIFLFNCALLDDPTDGAPVTMPWLDLLRDAPFFLAWHETHSRWAGVLPKQSSNIPGDTPILLLANPSVDTLQGSGEAIAWLETWR